MARRALGLDLSPFDEAWLSRAEVSLVLPQGNKRGLSFFFEDEAEFAAFLEAAELPKDVLEDERRLRNKFHLLPRYWLKLHYLEGNVTGFSQYFQVYPTLTYPITTLRLFLRRYGHGDVGGLEAMVEPALAADRTVYGLVLKREPDTVKPRLSLRVERRLLPELFENFVKAGYLEPGRAEEYLCWDRRMARSDFVYLSFDPGIEQACTLDFEGVVAADIPVTYRSPDVELPKTTTFNFAKCRLREGGTPEWTVYLMLSRVRAGLEYHPDGSPKGEAAESYLEEVRRYYDRISPIAVEHVGATYQAGLIKEQGELSPTASNLYLAARAGIKPGDRILDAGCGVCGPALDIARHIKKTTVEAVTLSEVQAEEARRLIGEAGLADRIKVQVGDYHHLTFPGESFDAVVFFESLGYAYDPKKLLANVYRMLRPGGRLYVKDVFRRQGELSAQELDELATFNRLYAFRAPTVETITKLLAQLGFTAVQSCDLSERISMARFHQAMFQRSALGSSLSAFGKRHFHPFTELPVHFWEVSAQKASSARESFAPEDPTPSSRKVGKR